MKIVFNQTTRVTSIRLIPENLKESSELIRLALNAKKEKPFQMFYSLSDDPYFCIDLLRVDEKNETRFIEKK